MAIRAPSELTMMTMTIIMMPMMMVVLTTMMKTMLMTFSLSSAAPSSLIFFRGATSGELFSSVGNAKGSDLPDNDEEDYDDVEHSDDNVNKPSMGGISGQWMVFGV